MKIVLVITVLIILLGSIALWLFFMPWYVNRKINCYQNELVNQHYTEVETMYRKMRGWRHDYHNHIQVMKAYMEMNQHDETKKYLNKLAEDLNAVDTVLKTGNVMVDAIFNSKLTLIKDKNIKVDATVFVPQNIAISSIDLSVLVGNLLDNAMEACMQMQRNEDRFIRIYIDIVKKNLYIVVTNSMKEKPKKNGLQYLSAKIGFHGFGILRIDSIASKYGGFVNRQYEQDVFATEVMIPLNL